MIIYALVCPHCNKVYKKKMIRNLIENEKFFIHDCIYCGKVIVKEKV